MSDSVDNDNLTSGQLVSYFKATSSILCAPDQARTTYLMFKHSFMNVRVRYLLFNLVDIT